MQKFKIKKLLIFFVVFLTITTWLFSGWPQIWQNPQIPAKIQETQAAVVFDAFSNVAAGTTNRSWIHTPVGTPRAVIVLISQNTGTTDQVTSVTYGGLALTRVGWTCDTAGEPGCVYVYFIGSGIPTGAQTVVVNVSGSSTKRAGAITLTGLGNTFMVASDTSVNADAANPTRTLNLNNNNSFVAEVFHSGQNAVGSITPFSGWTSRLEHDYGSQTAGWYTYNTVGSANVSVGWTQGNDDAAMVALAVSEISTILGDGVNPSDTTIGPNGSITDLDNFTLQTNVGTDMATAAEVILTPANAYQNIAQVDITDISNSINWCTSVTGLTSNTVTFSTCNIPVTTSLAAYKVRITPKTHANMPSPPGVSYDTRGTITSFTCTNSKLGSDNSSATITIDNASPNDATWTTITPGDGEVELNWTNPGTDFNKVLILRKAGSAISDTPTEGQEYSVPGTIGGSTIIYVNNGTTFIDTGLTNNTNYYYKIFAYDNYMNYAVGIGAGSYVPRTTTPATWLADPDTPVSGFGKDTVIRLRVQITNSGSEALSYNYGLEYAQKNGGTCGDDESFVVIPVTPTTEHFIITTSSYVADGALTTPRLPLPGHTFDSGKIIADPSESSGSFNLGFERYTEFEFVIKSTTSASGWYCFRTTNAGIALDEYAVYPELEIIP